MAWSQEFPGATVVTERAERAWRVPVGVVSPLWAMFGAAAGAGVAYWWVTQWTRSVNIEALSTLKTKPTAKPQRIEIIAEPAPEPAKVEAAALAEVAVPEPVAEAQPVAAAPEPVALKAVVPEAVVPQAAAAVEAPVETKPAPKPAAKAKPAAALPPDDLTRMTGIGPKLAEALASRGVTRFAQIAAWTADDLAKFDAELSLKGRAVREAWVAQAKRLTSAA
jgi:predicted flap endonuclease-1-like 5' DNA nuclease